MSAMVERLARKIAGMEIMAKQSGGVDERGHVMQWEDIIDVVWPLYRGHAAEAIKAFDLVVRYCPSDELKWSVCSSDDLAGAISVHATYAKAVAAMIDTALT